MALGSLPLGPPWHCGPRLIPPGCRSAEGPLRARAAAAGRGAAGLGSAAGRCAAGGAVMRQRQAEEAAPPARGERRHHTAWNAPSQPARSGRTRQGPAPPSGLGALRRRRTWLGAQERSGAPGRVPRRGGGSFGLRAGVSPPARGLCCPRAAPGLALSPVPRGAAHPATGPVRAALGRGSAEPWLDKDSSAKSFLREHDVKLSRSPVKMRLRRTSAPTPQHLLFRGSSQYLDEKYIITVWSYPAHLALCVSTLVSQCYTELTYVPRVFNMSIFHYS